MKDKNLPVDNNWITPKNVYDKLDSIFHFDFDPCPYNSGVISDEENGLLMQRWGKSNYVNPPYTLKEKEAFLKKAIEERLKGNTSVFLLPVSTSTKVFHEIIVPYATEVGFVQGRIKFQKQDEQGNLYTPKNGGMHDSMVVVFDANKPLQFEPNYYTIKF